MFNLAFWLWGLIYFVRYKRVFIKGTELHIANLYSGKFEIITEFEYISLTRMIPTRDPITILGCYRLEYMSANGYRNSATFLKSLRIKDIRNYIKVIL